MTNRPRLYPGHQHQWADDLLTDPNWVDPPEDDDGDPIIGAKPPMVTCTVCGFQAPRNAAGLDGRMAEPETPTKLVYVPGNVSEAEAEQEPA